MEQDHRFIKRLTKPGLGFFSLETAWRTLQGYEVMHMIGKGQVSGVGKGDILGRVRSSLTCLEWLPKPNNTSHRMLLAVQYEFLQHNLPRLDAACAEVHVTVRPPLAPRSL